MGKVFKIAEEYSLYRGDFKEPKYYLFNVKDGTIYRLNEVSYDILRLIDGINTQDQILSRLLSIYDGDANVVTADFENLLNFWVEKMIIIPGGE